MKPPTARRQPHSRGASPNQARLSGLFTLIHQDRALGGNLDEVVAGEGAIWVLDSIAGTVTPINPSVLQPENQIRVGSSPSDIALGGRAVWVTDYDGTIYRIDSASHQVGPLINVGAPVSGIAFDSTSGTLWVAVSIKP